MANRYSVTSGLASAVGTWDGGATVPGTGDRVLICHPGTGGATFSTNTAGYAIGATAITLTGTVLAGSFVVGESVQFPGDPNYYAISGWNSSTKVLTIAALIVAIPASATVVTNCGHVVKLDGTYEWGDDTTSTIVINSVSTTASIWVAGTLKASRTVSSQLTCNGTIRTAAIVGAGIDYGRTLLGTGAEDPIPLAYTAKMLLNKSAVAATGKYGLYIDNAAFFYCAGDSKNPNATLLVDAGIGTSAITLDAATGWQNGDTVVISTTSPTVLTQTETKIIQSVNRTGASPVVTFTTPFTYLHKANGIAGNFSSNVVFTSYDTTHPAYNSHYWTNTQLPGTREYCYTLFAQIGSTTIGGVSECALQLIANSTSFVYAMGPPRVSGCMFLGGTLGGGLGAVQFRPGYLIEDCASYCAAGSSGAAYVISIRNVLNRCFAYGGAYGYRGPGATGIINSCKFYGIVSPIGGWSGTYLEVNNSFIDASSSCYMHITAGSVTFTACELGTSFGLNNSYGYVAGSGLNSQAHVEFVNCNIASNFFVGSVASTARLQDCTDDTYYKITNRNSDVTAQELYTPGGGFIRDNVVFNRSKSAIRCVPWNVGVSKAASYQITFPAPNGVAQTIVGYLRKNSSYGASTLPYVQITGLGITPVTFTMSNSVDTWEQFSLSATNSSGADGNLTLTFYGQSLNASAACYLDGIVAAPFVTAYRHYGYKFDSGSVTRAVDPITLITESAANALTGLALNFATSTLTITSSRTLREIYDWVRAQLVATANLSQPEFLTSADGINFNCSYNIALTGGAITGTGAISMPSNALTVSAGGTSTANITHNAGVFTSITVTGIVTGSRLQLYDVTTSTELYNGVPGTSYSMNYSWASNHSIRARITQTSGVTAYLPWTSTSIVTSVGVNFLVTQVVDTVYNANAIDGSSVTEYTTDYVNIYIDVSTGGATTPQRLYAWFEYILTTSAGIQNFFGGITAIDLVNYQINQAVVNILLDNISGSPVIVSGARLYRADGTTVIAPTSNALQLDPDKAYIATKIVSGAIWADPNALTVGKFLALT